jgi:hypothetical protein
MGCVTVQRLTIFVSLACFGVLSSNPWSGRGKRGIYFLTILRI